MNHTARIEVLWPDGRKVFSFLMQIPEGEIHFHRVVQCLEEEIMNVASPNSWRFAGEFDIKVRYVEGQSAPGAIAQPGDVP